MKVEVDLLMDQLSSETEMSCIEGRLEMGKKMGMEI